MTDYDHDYDCDCEDDCDCDNDDRERGTRNERVCDEWTIGNARRIRQGSCTAGGGRSSSLSLE